MPGRSPAARRRRRRRLAVTLAVALGVAGTGGAVSLTHLAAESRTASAVAAPDPAGTATVVRRDLVQRLRVAATVGYDQPQRLTGRRAGTLTWLPAPGTAVGRGERLYEVDATPVPLFFGGAPLHRPLALDVPDGDDVELVQDNLVAFGYDIVADGVFGLDTEAAVRAWQESAGLPPSGRIEPGDVVVAPGAVRVDSVSAVLGDPGLGPLMNLSGTERAAIGTIEPDQQRLLRPGTAVQLTAAALTTPLTGTVAVVAPKPAAEPDRPSSGAGGSGQQLVVTVRFADQQAAAALLDGASVDLMVDSDRRDGVLAVPVAALLALLEGGYALEVVDAGGGRRLLPVQAGMFADGLVEVTGDGLADGMTVVVAS